MKTLTLDVTHNSPKISEFIRGLGRITQPMEITLEGAVVGRVVPPGELSDSEKDEIVRQGWRHVQEARARNRGVTDRQIGKVIDAAVKRVRSRK